MVNSMHKILIVAAMALFSLTASVQAQESGAAASDSGWRVVAVGAGALAGIWAVNVATAGLAAPVMAAASAGNIGAFMSLNMLFRTAVFAGGAIAGGYVGGWMYDG
jgi:hypothetical protein